MTNLYKYFNYIDRNHLLSGIWNISSKYMITAMPYYLATNSELINMISKLEYTNTWNRKQEVKDYKYITITNDEINTKNYGVPVRFGDEITFGGQNTMFGDRSGGQMEIITDGVSGVPEIMLSSVPETFGNNLDDGVALVRGSDFFVDKSNGSIFVNNDLARTSSIKKNYKFTSNYEIERVSAKIWNIFTKKEKKPEDRRFGYSNRSEISRIIFDTAGIEFYTDQEVIVDKYRKWESDIIITDKNVYRTPKGSKSKYAIGQKVEKFSPVIDGIDILVPGVDMHIPVNINLITLPASILDKRIGEDLKFPNSIVPTSVSQDADGVTKIEFQIIGNPASVNMFWQLMHEKGKMSGETLARKLDKRKVMNTEPDASTLPRFINPAKFVFDNVLAGKAVVIAISENIKWAYDIITGNIQYIRENLPVGSNIIVYTY